MELDRNIFISLAEYERSENDRVRNHNLEPGLYVSMLKLLHPEYAAAKLIVEVSAVSACAVGHTVDVNFLDDDMNKALSSRANVDGGYTTSFENGLVVRPAALKQPRIPVEIGYLKTQQDDYDIELQQVTQMLQVPTTPVYRDLL